MDNERIRAICMALPHVAETVNWGHHLVYWAGDRDIGGKMFAMTNLDGIGTGVLWFHCGPSGFTSCWRLRALFPRLIWPRRIG
jgi:predicted DNA-binding protein (MmcQ/YjbR family)